MATRPARSNTLEPPTKSVELIDSGAHDLDMSGDDEHFSDALEGHQRPNSRPPSPLNSRPTSPIPRTRVERVDDEPRHGETPGSPAYDMRRQDAVPDELEIVPEGRLSKRSSSSSLQPSLPPGGPPVPLTVVEKVDPASPSHGEVPGTAAYEQRQADAAPDVVLKASDSYTTPQPFPPSQSAKATSPCPIPETIITRADSVPGLDETSRTGTNGVQNHGQSGEGSPTLEGSPQRVHSRRKASLNYKEDSAFEDGFGDDFDEFEEGAQPGEDDDFGDFDDGIEGLSASEEVSEHLLPAQDGPGPAFPILDFGSLSSLPDIIAATQVYLDAMFPSTTKEKLEALPKPDPVPPESPIFPTERSRALWEQLITPPPLQPPNWTKSRIRRLFLVSLGVPVDLDEILPPSKQKKLVLPDMHLEPPTRKSESDKTLGSVSRLKAKAANDSNASIDSNQSSSRSRRRARGPLPPPDLDLGAVKRLCATTDEKLDGLTVDELKDHIQDLESKTEKTQELLEYWLKRRDGAVKEKEAFEGVIENLVRHARRVRK
ncbi:hypothetical protein EPUS_03598 [Endocarpon pusillum Z07020]|uniref:Uncharacterized protein n=1 Tax=Endocarpon pusillum (strain Z07020 / HMAS-L-300199) TaxID=1263415 RepID=U1GEA1_ENDPU|nr:uncharacterized protein EPUS_03598 [Endocarpon pusillum Z07020]ERF70046.1 hypothetical protein EPUS_03598 [Endocarpon pusillum Z07020]